MKRVKRKEDREALQKYLDKIVEMQFNTKKCRILELGRNKTRLKGVYSLGNEEIKKKSEEKKSRSNHG